jgi:hypothetical protein
MPSMGLVNAGAKICDVHVKVYARRRQASTLSQLQSFELLHIPRLAFASNLITTTRAITNEAKKLTKQHRRRGGQKSREEPEEGDLDVCCSQQSLELQEYERVSTP